MEYILLFIIGAMLGSFFNVYALRRLKGISIIKPNSYCYSCKTPIKFYENIPIISYILLRGKCSTCNTKISINYFLAELFTPLLLMINYYLFNFSSEFYISSVLSSVLIITFITDFKEMLLLDEVIYIGVFLISLIILNNDGFADVYAMLGHGVIILSFMTVIKYIGNYIFKKESLGDGDIKLSFLGGFILGPILGLFYPFLAAYIALPFAVYGSIKKKNEYIAFGPFLIFSIYIIYIKNDFFIRLLTNLIGL